MMTSTWVPSGEWWIRTKKAAGLATSGLQGVSALRHALEESRELLAAHRVLQFFDGLGLDLSDPLPGNLENAAHFFEGVGIPISETVAQTNDLPLAIGERFEQGVDLFAEQFISGCLV